MSAEIEEYYIKLHDINSGEITEHLLTATSGLHEENGNVIWDVKFEFKNDSIHVENKYFLSEAMNKIREIVEPKGYRPLVICANFDASHSGMQADMSAGAQIYKLEKLEELRKNKSSINPIIGASFHVFDESKIDDVVTLEEQEKYRKDYFNSKRKNSLK